MLGAVVGGLAGAALGGNALSTAIGSGIGTLLEGKSGKQAIKNALIGGAVGMVAPGAIQSIYQSGIAGALRGGAQNLLGGMGFGPAAPAAAAGVPSVMANTGTPLYQQPAAMADLLPPAPGAVPSPARSGIAGMFKNMDPMMKGSLALTAIGALQGSEKLPDLPPLEQLSDAEVSQIRADATRGLYVDPMTGARYDSPQERDAAMREREQPSTFARGGFIEGPGTETSDSIPAMIYQDGSPVQEALLSDGEFVMTGRAVRGAGDGDREAGAARMYELMRQFEQRA